MDDCQHLDTRPALLTIYKWGFGDQTVILQSDHQIRLSDGQVTRCWTIVPTWRQAQFWDYRPGALAIIRRWSDNQLIRSDYQMTRLPGARQLSPLGSKPSAGTGTMYQYRADVLGIIRWWSYNQTIRWSDPIVRWPGCQVLNNCPHLDTSPMLPTRYSDDQMTLLILNQFLIGSKSQILVIKIYNTVKHMVPCTFLSSWLTIVFSTVRRTMMRWSIKILWFSEEVSLFRRCLAVPS